MVVDSPLSSRSTGTLKSLNDGKILQEFHEAAKKGNKKKIKKLLNTGTNQVVGKILMLVIFFLKGIKSDMGINFNIVLCSL